MKTSDWVPALDGREADEALDRARQIAARLRPDPADPTLGGGLAGHALLLAALGDDAAADERVDEALGLLATTPLPGGLIDGYAGVGFVAALRGRRVDALDSALQKWVARPDRAFDLVTGLVGVGVYALERGSAGGALLRAVVDRLADQAVPMDVGHSWPGVERTEPVALGPSNLGMAHGTPGVVALLARAARVGVGRPGLAEGAVAHLLAARTGPPGRRMPYSVGADADPRPARTAWCYGDPGVAVALWLAGEREAAIELAVGAAGVEPEEAGVLDEGVCHGAAGLGLICHRLWVASGEPALRDGARRWYLRALARDADRGPRLLTGDLGVALALVAAATDRAPRWDRALLLSGAHDAAR